VSESKVTTFIDNGDAGGLGLRSRLEVDWLTFHLEIARVALVEAGHDLHQGRLAGPVFADQRVDRARMKCETS